MTFSYKALNELSDKIVSTGKFPVGILDNILLTEIKRSDKLQDVISVVFRDEKTRAINFTSIFGPDRKRAKDDEAYERQVNTKLKVIVDLLCCVYGSIKSLKLTTFGEQYEMLKQEVISLMPERETWTEVIDDTIAAYNNGLKKIKYDDVRVAGVWTYNTKGYVGLRQNLYSDNIVPAGMIHKYGIDPEDYFYINEKYDILDDPTREDKGGIIEDDGLPF